MAEVRVFSEGSLRVVQASGSGRTWATASAPVSALFAYVKSFSFTSAQEFTTIDERGIPDHHKFANKSPIEVTMQCLSTGGFPSALTASGATVPMFHMEHRASAFELGAATGSFYQFHGAVLLSNDWAENADGNTFDVKFRCLAINGPTASGYLS
jgi:hypothetical protein